MDGNLRRHVVDVESGCEQNEWPGKPNRIEHMKSDAANRARLHLEVSAYYRRVDGHLVPRMCRRLIRAGAGPAMGLWNQVALLEKFPSDIGQ